MHHLLYQPFFAIGVVNSSHSGVVNSSHSLTTVASHLKFRHETPQKVDTPGGYSISTLILVRKIFSDAKSANRQFAIGAITVVIRC